MPRFSGPSMGKNEKSKDFFGTIKRLFLSMKKWKALIVIALVLSIFSATFSIVAPNKVSDFANYITEGLKPNTDNLNLIIESVSKNIKNINYQEKINIIAVSKGISDEDRNTFFELINDPSINKETIIFKLPDSIINILIDDIYIDEVYISGIDQVKMISLLSKMDNKDTSSMLKYLDEMPDSIYSLIKPKFNTDGIKNSMIILIFLYSCSMLFSFVQGYVMAIISNSYAKHLRSSISNKINLLPLKYFDVHEQGDILSRVTNDVDTIGQSLNQSFSSLIFNITMFLGSIIMMFKTNYIMAITAVVSSLIGFTFMIGILKNSQKYFSEKQKSIGELNGYVEEIYSGHNVVKVYNGVDNSKKHFEKLNKKLYNANIKSQFLSGLMPPIMGFIGNFGYVAVCIVGALLVLNQNITFGVIVAFMIYVRLFTNPLSQIAQSLTQLQSASAAAERVFEFLDEKEMNKETTKKILKKKDAIGNIEFKNVKFGYDDNNKLIIKNFSTKVSSGQKIAIVGPTGAGKTTMVNLLMKFYEINDGDIIIDGYNTKELTRENIHDLFCMVLQDTWLFEATIRDNIKFNRKNISDKEIWNALKVVGIDHFIKTLPGGLDYVLGDNDSISSGQKQLLTIARGMLENAPFLILDEATSNVDTRTEELVQKAMDKLSKGKTSFIIAHRLSTIKNADLILVMNEGNIIEQGNHEELMNKNGFYAKLYNSQFENVN